MPSPDDHLDQTVVLPGAPLDQTVVLDAAPLDQTVVLDAAPLDQTVALASPPVDRTTALTAAPAARAAQPVPVPVPVPEDSATMLDEEAWPTPATGEFRRFGPGVPVPTATVPLGAAAAWHGEPAEPERRRRRTFWLIPLLVLLLVLGYLGWQWWSPALTVTGVAVQTDPAGPGCNGTQTVTGTLDTKGGAGTVTYRWHRSDGTISSDITQPVPKGEHHTQVTLRWTFEGKGSMNAVATLEVVSPGSQSAAASFTYSC
ncbi:hypothetical protein [Streptomyces tateyamensis]|nr:hypothetical protein [Streptomyces tateyamensis]